MLHISWFGILLMRYILLTIMKLPLLNILMDMASAMVTKMDTMLATLFGRWSLIQILLIFRLFWRFSQCPSCFCGTDDVFKCLSHIEYGACFRHSADIWIVLSIFVIVFHHLLTQSCDFVKIFCLISVTEATVLTC